MQDDLSSFTPQSLKELTHSLFLVQGAHKNLEKERVRLETSINQMSYLAEKFSKYSDQISEKVNDLDHLLPQAVLQAVQECGKDIADEASRAFIQHSSVQAESTMKKMVQSTTQCENKIHQATKKIDIFSRWFLSVAVISALAGGCIGGAIMRYISPPALDKASERKINAGEILESAWPGLTQKEKDRIISLVKAATINK